MDQETRSRLARETIEATEAHYQQHGEEGDFADGLRYYLDDATDEELVRDHAEWTRIGSEG